LDRVYKDYSLPLDLYVKLKKTLNYGQSRKHRDDYEGFLEGLSH